jgi:SAM-dependent methyltransferase
LFAPNYPFDLGRYVAKKFDPLRDVVVDLGSGNHRMHPYVFTLDAIDYTEVDLVCDMQRLPFRPGSIDVITTYAVLEHVPEVDEVVEEIANSLRPMGHSIHLVPFLYPFHASPDDFRRYTHMGCAQLFEGWRIEEQFGVGGPFSLFNAVAAEYLSILTSFGRGRLRALGYLLFSAALAPLKFADVLFTGRRAFLTVAPIIMTHLRKPGVEVP